MDLLADVRGVLGSVANRALDLALPAQCAGCRREGAPLCAECLPALDVRLEAEPGVPIGLPADIPPPLLQLEWCAPFTGVTRRALHALKYDGERRLAPPMGAAIARRWARVGVAGDALVPVPASPDRVRERGYDQAALLAGEAARRLRLPMLPALERTRATTAQFDLDRAARAANLGGAFRVADPATVRSAWIVLVDDVMTTGATLAACATALLEAGAGAVSAVAVARER
jgi:ComF family protein